MGGKVETVDFINGQPLPTIEVEGGGEGRPNYDDIRTNSFGQKSNSRDSLLMLKEQDERVVKTAKPIISFASIFSNLLINNSHTSATKLKADRRQRKVTRNYTFSSVVGRGGLLLADAVANGKRKAENLLIGGGEGYKKRKGGW